MPKTFDDDWIAFPHAVGVLERLKTVMADVRLPLPCTATVLAGDLVAYDYIGDECDSFAWSRVSAVFPSTAFPQPDETPNRLLTFATGVDLGLIRKAPVPDNGEPADPEEHYESARTALADMRAMLQAICEYGGEDIPLLIGQYTPVGPEGGVVGGVWSFTVGSV